MSNDAKQRLDKVRADVTHEIAKTMDLYGATPSMGELYGVMFFEGVPMTLDEMKEHLGMSKSSMSYAVRNLMASKMVTKLQEKENRRELYQVEENFYKCFQNFFTTKLQREIDLMSEALDEALPQVQSIVLDVDTPDDILKLALTDFHKLTHVAKYYQWLQSFVNELENQPMPFE